MVLAGNRSDPTLSYHPKEEIMNIKDLEDFYTDVITAWYQHNYPEDLEECIEWIINKYAEKGKKL